jgi:Flp pilus assembly protein TadG
MRHRRLGGDDGAATTELVIILPTLLFFILLIVQLGLYFHAINVASAAAQEGAHEASLSVAGSATPDLAAAIAEGEDTSSDFIQRFAPNLLGGVAVTGQAVDDGEMVRITVSGDVTQTIVIPGIDFGIAVSETAESAVERFRPAGDAPTDTTP